MKDIANKAGVSKVTVSRALNNKPDINKDTRILILKIAEELGYTPNDVAKSLATKRTNTLGIIVPDSLDSFYPEIVQGVGDQCRENDFSIVLCYTHGDADKEIEYIKLLKSKRVDGIIIYPVQEDDRYIDELQNSMIPFVLVGRHTDALDCDYVINDNVYGAYLAVNHLLSRGYRKIIYVCAKPTASSGKERIEGCKRAILEKGLPLHTLQIVTCNPQIDSCYHVVRNFLPNRTQLNAIFVWDDKLALGAFRAIYEARLRIPADLALVGYNDTEIARHLYPPLTTVRHASYDIGKIAANTVLKKITSTDNLESRKIVLKPELVVRQTT
ncbi:LacI family DNA-binding transcriptional regulator [candidate division KSB1 bacterium]|nr:LacI family DNA-binding transcriptional regulator [candidate division KSB1 bacterium]